MQQNEENKTAKETNPKLYIAAVLAGIVLFTTYGLLTGKQDTVLMVYKSVGLLLLALSILVGIHEWGHYITAKMFGMRVEKFYLFFDAWGIKLWSTTKNGTEYGIGWLPLGGYVKIAGMVDENMDTSFLESEPQPWEFRSKPVWQRLIVMVAGVVMNIILGIFIISMLLFTYGEERTPISAVKNGIEVINPVKEKTKEGKFKTFYPLSYLLGFKNGDELVSFKGEKFPYLEDYAKVNLLVKENAYYEVKREGKIVKIDIPENALDMVQSDSIIPNSPLFEMNILARIEPRKDKIKTYPAEKAGLKRGDLILKLDSIPIKYFVDIINYTNTKKPLDSMFIQYSRDGQVMELALQLDSVGKMGLRKDSLMLFQPIETKKYGFFQSFAPGAANAFSIVGTNISGLAKMIKGKISVRKSVRGPVGMGQAMGQAFDRGGWKYWVNITGVISMMLAFFNIIPLPLPVLDGGHVMFLLYEWIRGKPAPMKVFFIAQNIGIFLVLGLMLFTFGNDVLRLITG